MSAVNSLNFSTPARRAFSLIEVLIGIVVLALGLIGLAAVFPTVVRQQQIASDVSSGVSAVRSAISSLNQHSELSRPVSDAGVDSGGFPYAAQTSPNTILGSDLVGWSVLTWDAEWSPDMEWILPTHAGPSSSANGGMNIDPSTGEYVIGWQRNNLAQIWQTSQNAYVPDPRTIRLGGVTIPMRDRLIPAATPGVKDVTQSRFVWDFVARRFDDGTPHYNPVADTSVYNLSTYRDDGVQIAVFVRRIDPGIRVRGGYELSDEIAPIAGAPNRVAVAASANGAPTLDGLGSNGVSTGPNYSTIQSISFVFSALPSGARPDVVDITGPAAMLPFAAQVGQMFVDQLGVVHKVAEVQDAPSATTRRVRLETPIRADYTLVQPVTANRMTFIFSPQIPASVDVFTIAPSRSEQ